MSELLDAARRLMATTGATRDHAGDAMGALPETLPYADYVRRFEPPAESFAAVTHASAVAHLLRISRALETLNGFALAQAVRPGAHDSDHLYSAHGDPRD